MICAGMTIGAPRVDLAALLELKRLLLGMATRTLPSEPQLFGRKAMKLSIAGAGPVPPNETVVRHQRLDGLSALERNKVGSVLAQILMQAAGLIVEELGDDRR